MKNIPSIKKLREICQLPVRGNGWAWHAKLARSISIYITKFLLYTPVSANQVTQAWGIMGVIGAILLSFGYYWYTIIAVILLAFAYILDHVDGEIARYKRGHSAEGIYLDILSHSIVDSFVFACLSFGVYNISHNPIFFVFGFSASLSALWRQILLQDKEWKGLRDLLVKHDNHKKKMWKKIVSKVPRGIWGHEALIFMILAGVVFNFMYIVLAIYGIFLPLYAVVETGIHYRSKYGLPKD